MFTCTSYKFYEISIELRFFSNIKQFSRLPFFHENLAAIQQFGENNKCTSSYTEQYKPNFFWYTGPVDCIGELLINNLNYGSGTFSRDIATESKV